MRKLRITIEGPIKSGKTTLACAIANLLAKNDIEGTYIEGDIASQHDVNLLVSTWPASLKRMAGKSHVEIVTKTLSRANAKAAGL